MRKILICLLVVSLSVSIFAVSGNAQKNIKKEEIITNATIVKMVKAKLGDTIILSKIKSGKTDFDLSTDAIVKLKESRVSDKVIEAMMSTESDSSPQTPAITVTTPPKVKSVSPPQTQEVAVATPPRAGNVLPPQAQGEDASEGVSSGKEGGVSSGKSEASSPSQERIIVPGGLKNGKLNNLWKVAKNKCFEMNFVVSNEDKETGNLFCTMQTDGAPRTIKINFNEKGFSVETRGLFGNSFLTRFDKYPALHKSEMEKTLKQAVGIKD